MIKEAVGVIAWRVLILDKVLDKAIVGDETILGDPVHIF